MINVGAPLEIDVNLLKSVLCSPVTSVSDRMLCNTILTDKLMTAQQQAHSLNSGY